MALDVFGFGNALVDILVQIDDDHIAELDLKKGLFHLVDNSKIEELLRKFESPENKIVPAGSCANTIFALSSLGADVALCGKIGNDPHGKLYEEIVLKDGINSRIKKSHDVGTGRVINLITPDSERTFVVNLGASVTLEKEELHDVLEDVKESGIFHMECYVIEEPVLRESVMYLARAAKENGVKISVDLSDPGVIERNLEYIRQLVEEYADIVFLNEEEAKVFTGLDPDAAVNEISKICETVIVKLGSSGSLVKSKGGEVVRINAVKASPVDTTGAGDFYAAGFLYGLSRGKDIATCGKIGSIIAGKIVEQIGARPPADLKSMPELEGLL